jgi:uncharacterized protein YbjT (DUF2867 family)
MSGKQIIAVFGATGAQGGGLARGILADRSGAFAVRAITRDPTSEKAQALAQAGAEVVAGDADKPETLEKALAGAHGTYAVTNFWEHFSPEREVAQATAIARATKRAGVKHVVWSTLEDTRKFVPLSDGRLPTLNGKYKVPHFDGKGEADAAFAAEAAPTSYLLAAWYFENMIYFGMGPRRDANGALQLSFPLGGQKLPGIAAEDIGKCALGIFRKGASAAGQRFGVAGDVLSGEEYAAKMSQAFGEKVAFQDVPFDVYRGLGFPGAEDLGNMFEFQQIRGKEFLQDRDPKLSRELNPELQSFDAWLAANGDRIPRQ